MLNVRGVAFALFAIFLFVSNISMGAAGDTIVVPVYQNQDVVTNGGSHRYYKWGEFPTTTTTYNKVIMYLTFQCPDTMQCGEWDYLDPIYIGRTNGVNGDTLDWEFARFITPYGNYWQAGSTWKHGWYYDVTDFANLLHDSVEIIYDHTGYETSARGWKINITFLMIEGTPEKEVKNITRLYQGGYAYNSNIETGLSQQTITYGPNTNEARIKVIQSGHGMDEDNCSEFCPRERWVKYDADTVNQRFMWRECGFNSLFPQGGTWLYDRGNWCPGASVKYDDIDIHGVTPGSTHTFDIDMQYADTFYWGTQVVTAYVIEYGAPNFTHDVSLESIVSPSKEYEFSRMNPICAEPVIVIKNNGTTALTSLDIVYGVPGGTQSTFAWTGNLPYLGIDTVRITQPVNWTPSTNVFQVQLQNPNGQTDQNNINNFGASPFTDPQVLNVNGISIVFQTNNAPSENHYNFYDLTTGALLSQKLSFANAGTIYRDTILLTAGHCYRFEFYDDGPPPSNNPLNNDGLYWWANTSDGTGLLRFTSNVNQTPIKSFASDFGTKIYYDFLCKHPLGLSNIETKDVVVMVYPNPSSDGVFTVDYTLPGEEGNLDVYNMIGAKVYSQKLSSNIGQTQVPLSGLAKGYYLIKVTTPDKLVNVQKVVYQ